MSLTSKTVMTSKKSLIDAMIGSLIDWNLSVIPPGQQHKMPAEEVIFSQSLLLSIARQSIEFLRNANEKEPAEDLFRQVLCTFECLNPLNPPPLNNGWLELFEDQVVTSNPLLSFPSLKVLLLYSEHADEATRKMLTLQLPKAEQMRRDSTSKLLLTPNEPPYRISSETRIWLAQQIFSGSYVAAMKKNLKELHDLAKILL